MAIGCRDNERTKLRHEQIILRSRQEDALQALMPSFAGKRVTAMPFALAATHLMMAKGQLNDKDDLTFFVDSGLADDEGVAFIVPIQLSAKRW